jgi:hypothetical protein
MPAIMDDIFERVIFKVDVMLGRFDRFEDRGKSALAIPEQLC